MATRTPIGRVKSYGSARDGAEEWKAARLTSVASGLLSVWLIVFVLANVNSTFEEVRASLAMPLNTTAMLLFVAINFWHTQLGVKNIVEDYVHGEWVKTAAVTALNFTCVTLAVLCGVATLKIAFGS